MGELRGRRGRGFIPPAEGAEGQRLFWGDCGGVSGEAEDLFLPRRAQRGRDCFGYSRGERGGAEIILGGLRRSERRG